WVLPGLVGPLAAGVVAEQLSWRWVFVGLLPLVGSALLLLMPLIRHPPVHAGRPIRWPRLLPALGVAAGAALVETAGAAGSPFAAAAYVAAGVLVLVLSLRCLVPARTLALGPGAAAPVALRGLFAGVFFGVEMLLPLAMAVQHRQPPTEAAIPLACAGLPCAIGAWWHGSPQAAAVSTTRIVRAGFLLLALGVALTLAAVRPGSLGWMVYPGWAIAGLAAGAGENRINASLLRYSAAHARGANSAALQLSDAAGAAVTTGVGGVLVAAAGRGELSYTACFTAIFGAMGGLALLGALWAGRIRPGGPGS
ncbi:MAG: MFS transporter, partial [Actinobacteria bacterium]|nr:MFS transporter [Actinomycetota bacterium]